MAFTKDYNTVKLLFNKLIENKYIKGMSFSYPKYENDIEIHLQTPWFLNKYGIPKINKYNKTDQERLYINLPLIKNEETNDFIEYLKNLDNYLDSQDFRISMKISDKFNYVPLIKQNENSKDSTPTFKIKLKTSYEEKTILTKVYKENSLIEFVDINDLSKIISINCKIRCVIKPTKLWVSFGLKKYGVNYEMIRCQIEQPDEEINDEVEFL